jgi:hypothetical protein
MLIDGEDDASRDLRKMLRKNMRRSRNAPSMRDVGEIGNLPLPKGYRSECGRCFSVGKCFVIRAPSPYQVMARMTDHYMEKHSLECAQCYLNFADFSELAKHVKQAHVPPNERWDAQDESFWRNEDMSLPIPGGGKQASQRENAGGGGRGGGGRPAPSVPYIKVEDLPSEEKVRAKILAVKTDNVGFNDAVIKIAMNGRSFFFGLKASNENYELLFKAFGSNENKWVGEEFFIGLQWNDFYEKNFIQVFDAPAPKSKGK